MDDPDDADSKSARTRARILDAAAYVLSTKGYAGTRVRDVAQHAEVHAPAIYYYFSSRDDLIEHVLYAGIAHMTQHLHRALNALPLQASPIDRILAAVEAHLRHEFELSNFATASIRNSRLVPERLRARQLDANERYGRIWRELLDDLAAAGELRDTLNPRIAQLLIVGALSWAAEWWDPDRASLDEVIRNAQAIVRHGLTTN